MTDQTNHSENDHENEDRKGDPDGEEQQSETGKQDESKDDDKPSIFTKPLFWIILVVVVAGLVIGGMMYWLHARQFESTDDAFVDTHIVRLAPQVAGTLVQVADIDNRHVEAGRLLAVIKASGRDAQVAEAQANESQARAQFAQAQAQVTAAEAQRQQAAAQARVPMAAASAAV
jgi:membrane fusion protein (multidrug efflux system)